LYYAYTTIRAIVLNPLAAQNGFMSDLRIPLAYFMSASDASLQGFSLSRLGHAANLRKEIKAIEEELRIVMEQAGIAQWLLSNRAEILRTVGEHLDRASDVA
jgi:hypothetical protein